MGTDQGQIIKDTVKPTPVDDTDHLENHQETRRFPRKKQDWED